VAVAESAAESDLFALFLQHMQLQ